MSPPMQLVIGKDFCDFASNQLTHWSRLEGHDVVHIERGLGHITCVEQRSNYIPLIHIRFESGLAKFNSDAFRNGMMSISVSPTLAQEISNHTLAMARAEKEKIERKAREDQERIAREARENQARAEIERQKSEIFERFEPLAKKYNVPLESLWDDCSISPLCGILEKLETNEQIEEWMTEWVESKGLNRLAATIHYRRFKHSGDNWGLVKACKYLRKANLPEKVISIANECNSADKKIRSAIFTTRGGAFRDLGKLESAEESASAAIQQSPTSFHPHNLMGGILYDKGLPEEGDEHFAIAVSLGSNARTKDIEIRKALIKSAPEARQIIIKYLLEKNPKEYAWVQKYEDKP